jgi:glutamate-1-semialdehyde 2,1-aminomutase
MSHVAPQGPVYQAGTLSGNPVAMAAGIANLELIAEPGFYDRLSATTKSLADGFQRVADEAGIPMATVAVGGMFGFFFTEADRVTNFDQAAACDLERFKAFFTGMLAEGVYLAPSAFEAGFVSAAHSEEDVAQTLTAMKKVLATL